ncbi:Gfo/Idh/MocA family oxidoreductase [Herbiconiux moechotypicola]|uniref:Gfo/Idh/MocA family oxidoreductase n=1 Tax=Herbiconiux moechotypicola TaxID=637393 RepID=A0ABN3DXA9_9MICO|nr:Gfo/Idh/MocA family oxidoreductase [Herbiconiux moechotypicola]MCS5730793.1 Gfo/Idh/MocA family oxidoreductase [Herbiconiux moechotypicola]
MIGGVRDADGAGAPDAGGAGAPDASGPPPLKVAVVGAGDWGRQHARVFSARDDTTVAAVVGRTPERTRERAERYGAAAYTDLERMLDEVRPDLVSVCLPNEGHFEPTLQLIRAGVPLFVEKPLVFHLGEADELIAEAEARDLFFAINFNHRYAEPVVRAKALIDAGELGEAVFASWRFGGEVIPGGPEHAGLIETQCHGLDMLEHLVGPIASVSAEMTNRSHGTYTTLALALSFANGAVGTFLGSYDSSYAYPDTQRIEVNGTLGRVVVHDTVGSLSFSRAGDEVEQRWRAGYFNDEARYFAGTFDRHAEHVVRALRAGDPPPVHARAGRRALALAFAAIESLETGRRVATG